MSQPEWAVKWPPKWTADYISQKQGDPTHAPMHDLLDRWGERHDHQACQDWAVAQLDTPWLDVIRETGAVAGERGVPNPFSASNPQAYGMCLGVHVQASDGRVGYAELYLRVKENRADRDPFLSLDKGVTVFLFESDGPTKDVRIEVYDEAVVPLIMTAHDRVMKRRAEAGR